MQAVKVSKFKEGLGKQLSWENLAGAGRIMQFPRAADAQRKQYPAAVHQMVITAELGKSSQMKEAIQRVTECQSGHLPVAHTPGKAGQHFALRRGVKQTVVLTL